MQLGKWQPWRPAVAHFGGGGGGGRDWYAMQQRQDEQNRQNRIREGTAAINTRFGETFNDGFWQNRQKAALDYYTPQLGDQFADARKLLTFWLGDRGLIDSSVANEKTAELQKNYDTNTRTLNNTVLDMVNTDKGNVSNAQQALISDVRSSGDAEAASNAAASQVAALSQPQTFSPLADMFATFTGALKNQANLEQASAMSGGAYKPAFNTGLFGAPRGSVIVN